MAEKMMTVCDRCGEVKRETNHWWKTVVYRTLIVSGNPLAEEKFSLIVVPFEDEFPPTTSLSVQEFGPRRALCGERCLLGEITDFMRRKSPGQE